MYYRTEFILIIGCIFVGVFGLMGILSEEKKKKVQENYQNDTEGKKKIIKYFKDHKAVDEEHGIPMENIPKEMLDSGYISKMFQDDYLDYEDGKYFLTKKKIDK